MRSSELPPLPIGIQTFRDIINGGFLYVDKTEQIYNLIRYPKGVYFLARPRRFGKSLLVSTLEEIFSGNRELFKGLWLYDSPYQWASHPIIHIDFSEDKTSSAEGLIQSIQWRLGRLADQHGLTLSGETYTQQFHNLITQLASESQVVVLVDEYDKPLLDNLEDVVEAQTIREVLKNFYTILKALDRHIRFVFLTGVSKFSKVGVFSGLNNLDDISLDNQFATLLGITEAELTTDFAAYLAHFASLQGVEPESLRGKIREWYNGFCFSRQGERVYNPFSLLLVLHKQEFQNYWFDTGTPSFLLRLLKQQRLDLPSLEDLQLPELAFSTYDVESLEAVPLLYQAGYLTIKGYEPQFQTFTLSYPNYEVKMAFMTHLLNSYSEVNLALTGSSVKQLARALWGEDWSRFFMVLNAFLASIDYRLHIPQEKFYQTIFYLLFKLVGLEVQAEVHTNQGRIDAVLEHNTAVYIFEFKRDSNATAALAQIHQRHYFAPYLSRPKTIHLIGISFDTSSRTINDWTVQKLAKEDAG
jgi:hypothetical protein